MTDNARVDLVVEIQQLNDRQYEAWDCLAQVAEKNATAGRLDAWAEVRRAERLAVAILGEERAERLYNEKLRRHVAVLP